MLHVASPDTECFLVEFAAPEYPTAPELNIVAQDGTLCEAGEVPNTGLVETASHMV